MAKRDFKEEELWGGSGGCFDGAFPVGNGFLREWGNVSVLLFKVLRGTAQDHSGKGYRSHLQCRRDTACEMLFSCPSHRTKSYKLRGILKSLLFPLLLNFFLSKEACLYSNSTKICIYNDKERDKTWRTVSYCYFFVSVVVSSYVQVAALSSF